MAKFMAIRDNQIKVGPGAKGIVFKRSGQTMIGKEAPNKHWVEIAGDNAGKDLYEILKDKLIAKGIEVEETWDIVTLQSMLSEIENSMSKEERTIKMKDALDKMNIPYHPQLGYKKLVSLCEKNNIEI